RGGGHAAAAASCGRREGNRNVRFRKGGEGVGCAGGRDHRRNRAGRPKNRSRGVCATHDGGKPPASQNTRAYRASKIKRHIGRGTRGRTRVRTKNKTQFNCAPQSGRCERGSCVAPVRSGMRSGAAAI